MHDAVPTTGVGTLYCCHSVLTVLFLFSLVFLESGRNYSITHLECRRVFRLHFPTIVNAGGSDIERVTGSWGCAVQRKMAGQHRTAAVLLLTASNRDVCNYT